MYCKGLLKILSVTKITFAKMLTNVQRDDLTFVLTLMTYTKVD